MDFFGLVVSFCRTAFADAAEQAGIAKIDDFNTGNNRGVSYFEVNQENGMRLNASKAFLSGPSPNLTIETGIEVHKLLFDQNKRCIGVLLKDGTTRMLKKKGEVILSSGAVNSPKVLELSGIGNRNILEKLGIPCIHHNDQVSLFCVYCSMSQIETIVRKWISKMFFLLLFDRIFFVCFV